MKRIKGSCKVKAVRACSIRTKLKPFVGRPARLVDGETSVDEVIEGGRATTNESPVQPQLMSRINEALVRVH